METELFLYLLTRKSGVGYDEYISIVVAATSEENARLINPIGAIYPAPELEPWSHWDSRWAGTPDSYELESKLLGKVLDPYIQENSVIITDFNTAG